VSTMPELTPDQSQELRGRLLARLEELRSEIREEQAEIDAERSLRGSGDIYGPGEQSSSGSIRDVSSALINRDLSELNLVRAALRRLEDGTYGVCADCAEPIGYARLSAYPSASRCTTCQSKRENSG